MKNLRMQVCNHTPKEDEGLRDRPGVDARCDLCARPMDPASRSVRFQDELAHKIYHKQRLGAMNPGGAA